jgi:hypothetical protein
MSVKRKVTVSEGLLEANVKSSPLDGLLQRELYRLLER